MDKFHGRMQTLGSGSQGSATAALQFISGPHRNKKPFAPTNDMEFPVDLTSMFLDCGRTVENPEGTFADAENILYLHLSISISIYLYYYSIFHNA